MLQPECVHTEVSALNALPVFTTSMRADEIKTHPPVAFRSVTLLKSITTVLELTVTPSVGVFPAGVMSSLEQAVKNPAPNKLMVANVPVFFKKSLLEGESRPVLIISGSSINECILLHLYKQRVNKNVFTDRF